MISLKGIWSYVLTALHDEQTTEEETINVKTAPLISHKAVVSTWMLCRRLLYPSILESQRCERTRKKNISHIYFSTTDFNELSYKDI